MGADDGGVTYYQDKKKQYTMIGDSKFRMIYVENCSNISSQKPLFTGTYYSLEQIKERMSYFIPSHPSMTIEYYTKKFGIRGRIRLDSDDLPSDLECIYVYLRSKTPALCLTCSGDGGGDSTSGNHNQL